MNACLLLTLLTLVGASEDFNTNEIKKRMKLIGGIPSYGVQSTSPKIADKSEDTIKYSDPKLNLSYNASAVFDPKGMGHLYTVTNFVISLIQPNQSFPEDFLEAIEQGLAVEYFEEKWPNWLKHYSGIFIVVTLGLIFAILMPIIGLIFCCCRCCGNCGAHVKPEKKKDSCKRTTTTLILSGMAVLMLFGVVCAFVTNEYMDESLKRVTTKVSVNLNDVQLYLNNTEIEMDTLLIDNFKEMVSYLMKKFSDSGVIIKNRLARVSHADVLLMLNQLIEGMETVKKDLFNIQQGTKRLQDHTSTLGDHLDVTREELLQELHNCRDIHACRELLNHRHIAELKVVENFNELPDVADTFAHISDLLGNPDAFDSIQKKILEGIRKFDDIKFEISDAVKKALPDLQKILNLIEEKLTITYGNIKRNLNTIRKCVNKLSGEPLQKTHRYIIEYEPYRHYIGLGVSGALLIILLCITMGILFGVCGKRPEEMYSDDKDCCNTVSGARFLILATWLMFLFSFALMIIILAHFVFGVSCDVAICKPLKNPTDSKLFELIDKYLNVDDIYQNEHRKGENLKISQVIPAFHRNESIYEALKLVNVYNISEMYELMKFFNISKEVQQFKREILLKTDKFELLSPEVKHKLRELADSSLNDIHFEKYSQVLKTQVTNINLTRLSNELRSNAEKIPDHASSGFDLSKVKKLLRAKARFLELLERDSVAQIVNDIDALKYNVSILKEHLKFNHTSLKRALDKLLSTVGEAQKFLLEKGWTQIDILLDVFLKDMAKIVQDHLDRVVKKTIYEIGKTAPLSNAYNATLVATCGSIMNPYNGFWMSVGWSLLLFIPAIIFSVILASLYSKSESYSHPGMYGESEYLYDAYADRDNMPLAVAQSDKKKKNHHKNYQESYDNGGNSTYLQDYSAHLGRSDRPSTSNEARYNDMAPKHWANFSNSRGSSNPPRYHHPSSTEYERPPPYYYPGPERG